MKKHGLLFLVSLASILPAGAQTLPDEDKTGAWYMYFFQKRFGSSPWGLQGDLQLRLWEPAGDLEQLLLRGGVTYRPSEDIMFTLGYAHIRSGTFGHEDAIIPENRIYEEALLPQKIARRFYLTHRFRYEQRWIEGQDTRTRFRYNLFVNVPLNNTTIGRNTVYLALYNEIFINGKTRIGNNPVVQFFDRNRFYGGMGFGVSNKIRVQGGWMKQKTATWGKGQWQVGLHQLF